MSIVDDPQQLRVLTAEALAESLNGTGVQYALINGLYGYPTGIGRDLDLLVRPQDVPIIIAKCEEAVERFGWDRLLVRWSPYGTWQLFFIRKDRARLSWLEVDPMLKDTMVLGAAFLLGEWGRASDLGVDSYRGPFPVNKLGHYVKSQLRPVLYGDLARFERKYALEPVEDKDIVGYLQGLLGKSMADRYCLATKKGVAGVTGLGKELKWTLNSRFALRHPLQAMRNLIWSRIVRPIKLYKLTAGMVMQVVGPDIQDKTEILEEARGYLNGCFEARIKRHWIETGKGTELASGPRPTWLQHWLRVAYHCIALTWRYYFEDRFLPRSVIQFILYGGGAADLAMEPGRYGFRSAAGLGLMRVFVPTPIEIVLLPQRPEQMVAPGSNAGNAPRPRELDRWRAWAYNNQARNVVMAEDSASESGKRLGLAIVKEIEARFGGAQCKKLRHTLRQYEAK